MPYRLRYGLFEKFGAKRRFILSMSRLAMRCKGLGGVDENFGIKDELKKINLRR